MIVGLDAVLILRIFFVAFVVSAIAAYPVYRLLLAMKSRQIVSQYVQEHLKKQGTPTMGGIIIVIGFLASMAVLRLVIRDPESPNGFEGGLVWAIIVLFTGYAAIGFLDDYVVPKLIKGKRGLGWKQKFGLQILFAAVALLMTGVSWQDPNAYIAGFIILFFANAYNFVDGMDGLAGSVLLTLAPGIAAAILVFYGMRADFGITTVIGATSFALVGATLPFLFLNAPPAKIFMGDVGSLPIGGVLGLFFATLIALPGHGSTGLFVEMFREPAAVFSGGESISSYRYLTALLIAGVMMAELVPVPMQVFWVKVFKKRLFPMTPIHHGFEKGGWAESKVVWTFALTQALLVALALWIALEATPRFASGYWMVNSRIMGVLSGGHIVPETFNLPRSE